MAGHGITADDVGVFCDGSRLQILNGMRLTRTPISAPQSAWDAQVSAELTCQGLALSLDAAKREHVVSIKQRSERKGRTENHHK
jgi:hypothetical protein